MGFDGKEPDACPQVNTRRLEEICRDLLAALGEDPTREGLKDTPRRFAQMWRQFIEYEPGNIETAFSSVSGDQMIVVRGMKVYSMCEHHLLPFESDVSIGVISDNKVLGLSKYARVAHKHAHRLQLQERLVAGIAAEVARLAETPDVAVIARGEHLCMKMRGVRTEAEMVCSSLSGRFKHTGETRAEFLRLVGY
ncbi:MAG TPA: GTP cyclohydrolase I [Pyrinomonadaceae bacterium]